MQRLARRGREVGIEPTGVPGATQLEERAYRHDPVLVIRFLRPEEDDAASRLDDVADLEHWPDGGVCR